MWAVAATTLDGIVMSSDNARKKKARRHQAETGDSYTRSRRVTNHRPPEPPPSAEDTALAAAALSLLGIENSAGPPDVTAAWKANAARPASTSTAAAQLLQVPLGTQPDRTPLELTLGDPRLGSHGVLIGTTGSGKSTALQTLAFGLCARYSPEMVRLMFVTAKPLSSVFTAFENYPHIEASGTDLGEHVTALREVIARRSDALAGESAAPGADRSPTPQMVVVIEDFAELLAQDEAFYDVLNQLMRVGRSLGVHVLLAGSSLDGVVGERLTRNARYRIALRTATEECSRRVIGTSSAAHIPVHAAGSGFYCPHPDATPLPFQGLPTPRWLVRAVGRQFAEG